MKKLVVVSVMSALFVWTGVETYRYWAAKRELAANLERQRTVEVKLAHLKSLQVASKTTPVAKP